MILAFDTYYFEDQARTVALSFNNWADEEANQWYTEVISAPADYESGSFYKRELPCILSLLKQVNQDELSCIIVDGYAILDDHGKPGLGGHLYQKLNQKIPVIGVAKSDFRSLEKGKVQLLRGESQNPLFITAMGMEVQEAAECIKKMHGPYRMPTLLSKLDQATRHGLK